MRTRANKNYVASDYVSLRSLLDERHWRSATRSARECALAHSLFLYRKVLKSENIGYNE